MVCQRRVRFGLRALALLCVWSVSVSALGEEGAGSGSDSIPFAQYVPASSKLFVAVRQLGDADSALRRAHAWRLLPLLSGSSTADGKTHDLLQAVTGVLGLRASVKLDELVKSEMAVAAPSWSQLSSAVWLMRISDDAVLDRLFPRRQRKGRGVTRGVRFFQTQDGVTVCVRDDVVAVSRRWGLDSPLYQTVNLMAGQRGHVLAQSLPFRALKKYMPAGDLAVAYLVRDDTVPAETMLSLPGWPIVDRAVIALYEREGRLDVAIRAALATPQRKPRLTRTSIEQLLRLPQTTLFASVTTIDLDYAYATAAINPPAGNMGRYLAFLAAIAGASDPESKARPRLGPHVIVAWGQDLREGGSTPQLAVMMECPDGRAVRDYVRRIADRIIQLVRAVDQAKVDGALTVQESRHLGIPISYVPLGTYAEKSKLPFMGLLRNIDPAWTVSNGWLTLALSRDHIERVLEAQFGLVPTLATVPDVQSLRKHQSARAALSIIQAGLATDVLDQWLAAHRAGSASLLNPVWWRSGSRSPPDRQPRLGIGMKVVQEPGVVVVARVYPETAADGSLQPGDRILGIDGHLLSLTSPNSDLRRRWTATTAKSGPTLRVQRDGTAIDVVLPKKKEEKEKEALLSTVRIEPADAVRELASLGRTIPFASFVVYVSDEMSYSAGLSLRFAPEHISKTTTRE